MHDLLVMRLEELWQRDSDTRQRLLDQNRLFGGYDEEMQRVHRENANALADIVMRHGWPGITLVGPDGCRLAWLIAQHSICTPTLQRGFLEQLAMAAHSGDAPMKQLAMLTDRIRFNEGRPQVYGTVFDWNRHGQLDCEVEDRGQVDARRLAVGLGPFEQALQQQREAVATEGGEPPADFKAYKHQAEQWAREVGWR